jgi:hypothetical protein
MLQNNLAYRLSLEWLARLQDPGRDKKTGTGRAVMQNPVRARFYKDC